MGSTRNNLFLALATIFCLWIGNASADTERQEQSRKARYECKCQQKYKKAAKKGYIQCAKHKYKYFERPFCKKSYFSANRSYYYTPYYDPNTYYFNQGDCKKGCKEPFFYFN